MSIHSSIKNLIFSAISIFSTLLFSSAAIAAEAAAAPKDNAAIANIVMLVALGFVFYFLIFRPQSKRAKDHRDLVSRLQKGDEILTSGGILGKISRVTDDFLVVNIADNIEIMVQKQAVASALPKGTMKSIQ